MIKKVPAIIKVIRPLNFLIVIFSVLVSALICVKATYSMPVILAAAFSAAFAASAGNIINDIFDVEIDKWNRPNRPLPAKLLSIKNAKNLYVLFIAFSLVLAYIVNITAFVIALCANIILFFYSYRFKSVPLLSNFVVALMTGLAFLYGGIAVGNIGYSFIPAIFAFLINGMREIVKDMEDVTGDSLNKIYTFPQRKGYLASKYLILFMGVFLIAATIFPFIIKLYKIEYFVIIMVFVNPLIVFSIKKLFDDHSRNNLRKISFLLKLNMIFGLTAIYLGK